MPFLKETNIKKKKIKNPERIRGLLVVTGIIGKIHRPLVKKYELTHSCHCVNVGILLFIFALEPYHHSIQ